MTPERWQRLRPILDEAPPGPEERRAFLDRACAGDRRLRREVEELLALEGEAEGFLGEPAVPGLIDALASAAPAPRRLGPYRIVELIERGGMGEVYLARRVDDFEKEVALKLIAEELVEPRRVDRFHAERQILARLEHPGIARLLDGGTAADGRPYLVMERVDGVPIDRYCESAALSVRRRLELFLAVLPAVAEAHRNLVVHCDLKPSNVLVTAAGTPKLLDFGIARLLEPEEATASGDRGLTPCYASPEQLRGERVTAAADVYSLGVVLYELLTGELPYGRGGGDVERLRRICEEEPCRRRLDADLYAIAAKAMHKDPRRRYGSVDRLGADLRRYLRHFPVRARGGGLFYRAGKLLRRRRWELAAAALVAALLAAVGFSEWRRVTVERERAEQVASYLTSLFGAVEPDERAGDVLTVRQILDRGRGQLAELRDDPELYVRLLETLGRIHHRLGHFGEARGDFAESLELWRERHPGASPELARRLNNLAAVSFESGAYGEAEALFRDALAVRRKLGQTGSDLARNLANLAAVLVYRGAFEEAETLYREVLEIRRRDHGPEDRRVATTLRNLGWALGQRGAFGDAEDVLREALAIRLRVYGGGDTRVASVLHLLGDVTLNAGRREEAEAFYQRALAIRRERLGEGHPALAQTRLGLSATLLAEGETEIAAILLARALETFYRVKPAGDWEVADAEGVLGALYMKLGRFKEAEACLTGSYQVLRSTRGEDNVYTQRVRRRLAELSMAVDPPNEFGQRTGSWQAVTSSSRDESR